MYILKQGKISTFYLNAALWRDEKNVIIHDGESCCQQIHMHTQKQSIFLIFMYAYLLYFFSFVLFCFHLKVSVPIVSNDRCKSMFLRAGRHEFIPDIFLCAGHDLGFVFIPLDIFLCLFRALVDRKFSFTNGSKFFSSLFLFTENLIHVR